MNYWDAGVHLYFIKNKNLSIASTVAYLVVSCTSTDSWNKSIDENYESLRMNFSISRYMQKSLRTCYPVYKMGGLALHWRTFVSMQWDNVCEGLWWAAFQNHSQQSSPPGFSVPCNLLPLNVNWWHASNKESMADFSDQSPRPWLPFCSPRSLVGTLSCPLACDTLTWPETEVNLRPKAYEELEP